MIHQVNRRQYDWAVMLLLAAITLYYAWLYRDFAQDDAFITYRYAKNIASGRGFVYNLNEPLLGTTTPLYTLLLALSAKLSGQDIRLISHVIGALSLWVSGVTLYYLGKSGGGLLAVATSLVFISNPLLITATGMETFLLIAILLLALKSYIDGKFHLTALLLGLLLLTRYETAMFAGLLAIHFWIKHRKLPTWLASTSVIFTAWLAFAWYTFGNIIPQSALTKLTVRNAPFTVGFALGAIIWWHLYSAQNGAYYALLPLALLGGYSALRNKTGEQAYILILAWSAIYFVGAGIAAGSFSWYYGPLIPGFSILLAWGAELLIKPLATLLSRPQSAQHPVQRSWMAVFTVVMLGLVALQISSWSTGWVSYRGRVVDRRYVHYREAAQWLNSHANNDESLATEEIGVLGYYTDMEIIDLWGLVTPELVPWITHNRTEALGKAIELYTPDYILVDEEVLIEYLQRSPHYEPLQSFDQFVLWRLASP